MKGAGELAATRAMRFEHTLEWWAAAQGDPQVRTPLESTGVGAQGRGREACEPAARPACTGLVDFLRGDAGRRECRDGAPAASCRCAARCCSKGGGDSGIIRYACATGSTSVNGGLRSRSFGPHPALSGLGQRGRSHGQGWHRGRMGSAGELAGGGRRIPAAPLLAQDAVCSGPRRLCHARMRWGAAGKIGTEWPR